VEVEDNGLACVVRASLESEAMNLIQEIVTATILMTILMSSLAQSVTVGPVKNIQADVVVFDSTPAGISAAIAAARAGKKVAMVSEFRHVGGMQTSGLGNTNAGQRDTVGGLAREFHERILAYYRNKYGNDSEQVRVCSDGFHFEPHVALKVYRDWLAEAGVTCLDEEAVVSLRKNGRRIVSVRTNQGRDIEGAVFLDASYEGDLLKLAGCSYRVGREASKENGESLAGIRYPAEKLGQADEKIQPYDYRLCLTDVRAKQVPFRKPAHYDPRTYAFLAAQLRAKPPTRLHELVPLNMMPNRKTDSRTGEWVGASWTYPEASREERRRLDRAHRDYSEGYLWFVLTDESVPPAIREELSKWGRAQDEFVDNDNWPYRLYVRQGRRLVGDFVMTQRDVTTDRFKHDGVALGSFYLDVHPVQLVPSPGATGGFVKEGGLGRERVKPYEIPYRVLLPRRTEVSNLLVPVCCSASHVAYSTIRMEPVFMMLGHVAGVAAALSLDHKTSLHDLPPAALRARLADQRQILDARRFTRAWPFPRGD
jgi:hypothetical protein